MNLNAILPQLYEIIIFPLLTIGSIYLIYFISTKINQMKKQTNNDLANKYLDILDHIISQAVLATTQTYVESLKKQGKFDKEAQKEAFEKTYNSVMNVLTKEMKEALTSAIGDLREYVNNKIEAEVALNK